MRGPLIPVGLYVPTWAAGFAAERTHLPTRSSHSSRETSFRMCGYAFSTRAVSPTTYMSVEPIPHRDVIGEDNLALLRSIGYERLARWSELLFSQCLVVDLGPLLLLLAALQPP